MPPRGRYSLQPIDTSSRRSIEIESSTPGQPLIGPGDHQVVVKYFYHEGEFWKAVIPLDAVEKVFGQAFNFSKAKTKRGAEGPEIVFGKDGLPKRTNPFLSHVQSRFALKSGHSVELYPIDGDTTGTPAHRVHDFVYSVEVVGPLGATFNFRDGLAGNFLSAHRFLSTREMVFERIVVENQYVTESPALPLGESQKRALLEESLLRSHRAGMTERYYLIRFCRTNNCTSNPLQILDTVVRYTPFGRIGSYLYRLPISPRFYLKIRGLDSDPGVRKLVRTEFDSFIHDRETQQRKREHVRRRTRALRAARAARPGE